MDEEGFSLLWEYWDRLAVPTLEDIVVDTTFLKEKVGDVTLPSRAASTQQVIRIIQEEKERLPDGFALDVNLTGAMGFLLQLRSTGMLTTFEILVSLATRI